MKTRTWLLALAFVLLAACSKVNEENFSKVQEGMAEQEVYALLGKPSESSSMTILGVSGTSARWVSGDASITIRFVNGKVALKSFARGADEKAPATRK